jgi:hypothetical protein
MKCNGVKSDRFKINDLGTSSFLSVNTRQGGIRASPDGFPKVSGSERPVHRAPDAVPVPGSRSGPPVRRASRPTARARPALPTGVRPPLDARPAPAREPRAPELAKKGFRTRGQRLPTAGVGIRHLGSCAIEAEG